MGAFTGRLRFRRTNTVHAIASLDALMRRVQERSRASGQNLDQAAGVVVEDLERAVTALNTRTAPLVPGCGVLLAAAGLLLKGEPSSYGVAEFFLGLAIVFAIGGFSFLARALFAYAGRRSIGLSPTVDDVERLAGRGVNDRAVQWRGANVASVTGMRRLPGQDPFDREALAQPHWTEVPPDGE